MSLRSEYAALSDKGPVRTLNEDRWFADPAEGIYLVADGMGGQRMGGLAAEIVMRTLPDLVVDRMQAVTDLASADAGDRLSTAVADFSAQLRRESCHQAGLDGMGSTVVLALARGRHLLVVHLGDSRAYLWRGGILARLTKDHSLVQLLIDSGDVTVSGARHHPARGQLTRYVGMEGEPLPDIRLVAVEPDDRLLLVTDGITGSIDDEQLSRWLAMDLPAAEICQSLIEAASSAAGDDNATALLVRFAATTADECEVAETALQYPSD